MPDFAGRKAALRRHLLDRRRALDPAVRHRAAVVVQGVLTDLVRTQHSTTVSAYAPVGSEPGGADLPDVLVALLPAGGRLLLPVLRTDNDLDWALHRGALQAGPRGLREPGSPPLGVNAVGSAGLIVVPALAVDRSGRRLGRGGGSYDRALARVNSALTVNRVNRGITVALLHDGELVDEVPAEPHDRPVDAVITPAGGLLTFSGHPDWTK